MDGFTAVASSVDAAGLSYVHRDETLVGTCVSHALAAGEILVSLLDAAAHELEQGSSQSGLQRIWVACSILGVANTLLWLQYARDTTNSGDDEAQQKAKVYFDTIHRLVTAWTSEWRAAKQWLSALNALRTLYNAAYLGEIADDMLTQEESTETSEDDEWMEGFRPQPGNGQRSLIDLPNLQASLQLASCDTTARPRNVHAIWLQLTGGWPSYDFGNNDFTWGAAVETALLDLGHSAGL